MNTISLTITRAGAEIPLIVEYELHRAKRRADNKVDLGNIENATTEKPLAPPLDEHEQADLKNQILARF
jgi:hypothetical protein